MLYKSRWVHKLAVQISQPQLHRDWPILPTSDNLQWWSAHALAPQQNTWLLRCYSSFNLQHPTWQVFQVLVSNSVRPGSVWPTSATLSKVTVHLKAASVLGSTWWLVKKTTHSLAGNEVTSLAMNPVPMPISLLQQSQMNREIQGWALHIPPTTPDSLSVNHANGTLQSFPRAPFHRICSFPDRHRCLPIVEVRWSTRT